MKQIFFATALLLATLCANAREKSGSFNIGNSECKKCCFNCGKGSGATPATNVLFVVDDNTKVFSMQIADIEITKNINLKQWLTLPTLLLTEPNIVPLEICRALGLPANYTIPNGNYPITHKNGVFTIVFGRQ